MNHTICRACQSEAFCRKSGCIPITVEDAPVSTPEQTMTWSALAWTLTAGAGIAAVVMLAINWPVK